MSLKTLKRIYKPIVIALVLIPNVFVIIFGIESFPYTCAPMFGHYIDEETDLYLLKFEGVNDSITTDLTEYYGKPDEFFVRHFFSKVYGSTDAISPFTNRLTESPEAFQSRMNEFFNQYVSFISKKHNLSFDRIDLKVKRVNQYRIETSQLVTIGYFNTEAKKYYSLKNIKNSK